MAHTQFHKTVKIMRTDHVTEFVCLKNHFEEKGIDYQTAVVGNPQQNVRMERKHFHVQNVAHALRFQANLLVKFWGKCVLTARYLIN